MQLFNKFIIIASVVASALFAGVLVFGSKETFMPNDRINGLNLVATRTTLTRDEIRDFRKVNANWVSIIPYAFSRKDEPMVRFDYQRQWYGEKPEGAAESIRAAKEVGYRVMLKPHVWVRGDGWAGEFKLDSEEDWQAWENDFSNYILTYARLADSLDVDLYCIGTEYRHAVKERPEFWKKLIGQVRTVYKGPLTYAANWDNYQNITFWGDLDYIGVDAYFPLSENQRPTLDELLVGWELEKGKLQEFGESFGKPILFTEYGYQSVEYATKGHWDQPEDKKVDMSAQKNAYEALYRSFWFEPWFAGGFLWKWFPDHENAGGLADKRFTPQNKLAQEVVAKWYGR